MTDATRVETHAFQTEARQLLDLMVHSIYSNKDIFLRELVSNASDALDKLRYESLTQSDLAHFASDPHVRIEADKAAHTLSVADNGIGMSHDEVVEFIGTIAKSGSREFLTRVKEAKAAGASPELIGQFGVGFYSSFMVADRVALVTRSAREENAWKWESTGEGSYTLEPAERPEPGTTVTLHLKPANEEDSLGDYTDEWKIREIVRHYSDFVNYPIRMRVERTEPELDDEGKPKPGGESKTVVKDETLNSMRAIWTRPESEVEESEYLEFYKHVSHDWAEPLQRIAMKAEGTSEFRALLFIPAHAPYDLFTHEGHTHGIHLYIRRVFIMSDCKELIPEYLRFLRGVVDSEDLSLNISREILQKNRQIEIIRRGLVRKTLDTLGQMRTGDAEKYGTFWGEFGRVLKEGLFQDQKNRDTLLDLCLFPTTHSPDQPTSLADYVGRMKPGQDKIYFMTGESRTAAEHSPHLEAFREKGCEVLLLTDTVDEIWTQTSHEYKEKSFQSAAKGVAELGSEEERKTAEEERKKKEETSKSLLEFLCKRLDAYVKEVRISSRLTTSPVCLVGEEHDMSPQIEALLRSSGKEMPPQKRILEINPAHPVFERLQALFGQNAEDPRLGEYAELLYGQALLAEGLQPPDPAAFSRQLADLMARAM